MPVRTGLKFANNPGDPWNVEQVVQATENANVIKNGIVFYGPSYFTRWRKEDFGMTPLAEALLGDSGNPCAVNRGFGSSNAELQLYYYPRMVRPLEPKVLVYCCWGNEYDYPKEETWEIAQRVIAYAFADFPDIHIYIQSVVPSSKHTEEECAKIKKANEWMKAFAEQTPNCFFLDITEREEFYNPEIFVDDRIHFNQKGYDLFGEFYREALKDELARF